MFFFFGRVVVGLGVCLGLGVCFDVVKCIDIDIDVGYGFGSKFLEHPLSVVSQCRCRV